MAVLDLCKEELKSNDLSREERNNIMSFVKRQVHYESYIKFFKEVTDAHLETALNL